MEKIYVDHNASSPCSSKHYKEVFTILEKIDGNPSSTHYYGRQAKSGLEKSRFFLADYLQVDTKQVFFTSGATESNNIVVQSLCSHNQEVQNVLLSKTEHPSISVPLKKLEKQQKLKLLYFPVDSRGLYKKEELLDLVQKYSSCIRAVFLLYVNNETGVVNDVKFLTDCIKRINSSIHVHVDAVQALAKCELSWLRDSLLDSASFSSHKIGGFKGVGALYLKNPDAEKYVFLQGGSQELGHRAGTENLPGIISFGLKLKDLKQEGLWSQKTLEVKQYIVERICGLPPLVIHGDQGLTSCNTISFHIKGRDVQELLLRFELAGVAVSSGSACSSGLVEPSQVLIAMGFNEEEAGSSIRISLSPTNTIEEAEKIVNLIQQLCSV